MTHISIHCVRPGEPWRMTGADLRGIAVAYVHVPVLPARNSPFFLSLTKSFK